MTSCAVPENECSPIDGGSRGACRKQLSNVCCACTQCTDTGRKSTAAKCNCCANASICIGQFRFFIPEPRRFLAHLQSPISPTSAAGCKATSAANRRNQPSRSSCVRHGCTPRPGIKADCFRFPALQCASTEVQQSSSTASTAEHASELSSPSPSRWTWLCVSIS